MSGHSPGVERLVRLLPADPLRWILDSDEPAARWVVLSEVDGGAAGGVAEADPEAVRAAVLADPATQELLSRLGDWEQPGDVGGHNSPRYAPCLLLLLVDMGVRGGDDERVGSVLDAMLRHQTDDGRFPSFARWREMPEAVWSSLPCDHHVITEVLLRYGRGGDARVAAALSRIASDLTQTSQGPGWLCRPDPAVDFRGPGRKADVCPQVALEALRAFAWAAREGLAVEVGRDDLLAAARTCLRAWRERGQQKPYMFGHGRQFKTVKWPPTWYGVLAVIDTMRHYPELWSGDGAPEDRRAVAELAACLIAYNVGAGGRVTPLSKFKGFETFSWG